MTRKRYQKKIRGMCVQMAMSVGQKHRDGYRDARCDWEALKQNGMCSYKESWDNLHSSIIALNFALVK